MVSGLIHIVVVSIGLPIVIVGIHYARGERTVHSFEADVAALASPVADLNAAGSDIGDVGARVADTITTRRRNLVARPEPASTATTDGEPSIEPITQLRDVDPVVAILEEIEAAAIVLDSRGTVVGYNETAGRAFPALYRDGPLSNILGGCQLTHPEDAEETVSQTVTLKGEPYLVQISQLQGRLGDDLAYVDVEEPLTAGYLVRLLGLGPDSDHLARLHGHVQQTTQLANALEFDRTQSVTLTVVEECLDIPEIDRADVDPVWMAQLEGLDPETADLDGFEFDREDLEAAAEHPQSRDPVTVETAVGTITEALSRMERIIDLSVTVERESRPVEDTSRVLFELFVDRAWQSVDADDASLAVERNGALKANRDRFRRLLELLIGNALEHAGPDVEVTANVDADGFCIRDDGPGVPEPYRETIVEQEFTGDEDQTARSYAIVAAIAHAHGWEIELDADHDGAKFDVTGVDVIDSWTSGERADQSVETDAAPESVDQSEWIWNDSTEASSEATASDEESIEKSVEASDEMESVESDDEWQSIEESVESDDEKSVEAEPSNEQVDDESTTVDEVIESIDDRQSILEVIDADDESHDAGDQEQSVEESLEADDQEELIEQGIGSIEESQASADPSDEWVWGSTD